MIPLPILISGRPTRQRETDTNSHPLGKLYPGDGESFRTWVTVHETRNSELHNKENVCKPFGCNRCYYNNISYLSCSTW